MALLENLPGCDNVFVFGTTDNLGAIDPAIKDRFAGSICKVEELGTVNRARLLQKFFRERGKPVEDEFASWMGEVVTLDGDSGFSNRDIEYVATNVVMRFMQCKEENKKNCDKQMYDYAREAIGRIDKYPKR